MTQNHDALRQIGYIQPALPSNKRPIGFFIVAGCPLSELINQRIKDDKSLSDPLMPDVAGLAEIIAADLESLDAEICKIISAEVSDESAKV